MNRICPSLALLAAAAAASAHLDADGSLSFVQNGGGYAYDITLNNTGETTIGTLWYSWTPGEDYLPLAPTSIASPQGWTATLITNTPTFGYSVLWTAGEDYLLQEGGSLSGFKFDSTLAPSILGGNSTFGNRPPVGTSFVYEGAPFGDQGLQIVINPVPEPATFLVVGAGLTALRRRGKR